MAEVKRLLKEAKNALAAEDYDEAINCSLRTLKTDQNNYIAHVFLGKAYSCVGELKDAKKHYLLALKLQPENILAWKGFFTLFRSEGTVPDVVTFEEYFEFCGEYAEVLLQHQLPLVDLIDDIRAFKSSHKDCQEAYLRHLLPGNALGDHLGRHLMPLHAVLEGLIKILGTREQQLVSKIVSRERLKISASDPEYSLKINALAWEVYKNSDMDNLYQQLINITDQDVERRTIESDWLEYRIKVLKSMPPNLKGLFFLKVREMVFDMIIVEHDSLHAWLLYFEWKDYQDLDQMDVNIISAFMRRYPNEPLAAILYAWISSRFSSYDSKKFDEQAFGGLNKQGSSTEDILQSVTDEIDEAEKSELRRLMDDPSEQSTLGLSEEEVLIALTDNIKQAQQSMLAHRIISRYLLHSKQYEQGLQYVRTGITLVAQNVKSICAQVPNSKRELTLDLATIYTYHEGPKNHKAALALYEKLLEEEPTNVQAKMGKGLILVERGLWQEACDLLTEVATSYPDNLEVASELSWSKLHLDDVAFAEEKLQFVLDHIVGSDNRAMEFRALNYLRLAKTLIKKQTLNGADPGMENIKKAFKNLIQAIKVSDTFAPAYSTLGEIYANFYADSRRAFKCYQRSFELDASDLQAAQYMCERLCKTRNWQTAAAIAGRLIKEEKAKRALQKTSWPFRVLGLSFLEKQDAGGSIQWLQSALRVDSADVQSWIGLGQAYLACGRVEASLKAFERALNLDQGNVFAKYFQAMALANLGSCEDGIELLEQLTELNPHEPAFHISLGNILIQSSLTLCQQGFLTKSVTKASEAIRRMKILTEDKSCSYSSVWFIISNALRLFLKVQSKLDLLPVEELFICFENSSFKSRPDLDFDDTDLASIAANESDDNMSLASKLLILSGKYALGAQDYNDFSRTTRAALWYNMGVDELLAYHNLKLAKNRDAAIYSLKKSIEYQSNTAESWLAFGIASLDLNLRVSQHCFIKAAALSPREVRAWYDLAILALKNKDFGLARSIITKSLSMAPQNPLPWLAMALTPGISEDGKSSSNLLSHAFILSNGRSSAAQILYAQDVFSQTLSSSQSESSIEAVQRLTAASEGLDDYLRKFPDDTNALKHAIVISERLHDYRLAEFFCRRLSTLLEIRFESAQDESQLKEFGIIKAQMARISLGFGEYEAAIDAAKLSLGLLLENDDLQTSEAIMSNYIVLGLSSFFLSDNEETFNYFQTALERFGETRQVITLIAKILYSMDSHETRGLALKELVDCLSRNEGDLVVTLMIAAISLLDDSPNDMKAVLQELQGLPLKTLTFDQQKNVPFLVERIEQRLGLKDNEFECWKRSAFFFPNDSRSWSKLDRKISARVATDSQSKVTAGQMSVLCCELQDLSKLQRGIFLCPWSTKAVGMLKSCFI
ncbi:LAMI_0H19922g1_1 [Lachancea mirantina]|uniref:LAMI_0H19922g1_1 n=1 Tax=Lachancea mirantina TaxID=1230905 RepID=A0A1G4KK15_9SACH|nr:LAMI_0H19922g1_1 [Lachancea mirantina]